MPSHNLACSPASPPFSSSPPSLPFSSSPLSLSITARLCREVPARPARPHAASSRICCTAFSVFSCLLGDSCRWSNSPSLLDRPPYSLDLVYSLHLPIFLSFHLFRHLLPKLVSETKLPFYFRFATHPLLTSSTIPSRRRSETTGPVGRCGTRASREG